MLSRAGDVRCVGCALVDNMRAGAELNRMDAPYGTTGTYDTIIGINSPAMAKKPFPHSVRDDPDSPRTYGWCDPQFPINTSASLMIFQFILASTRCTGA